MLARCGRAAPSPLIPLVAASRTVAPPVRERPQPAAQPRPPRGHRRCRRCPPHPPCPPSTRRQLPVAHRFAAISPMCFTRFRAPVSSAAASAARSRQQADAPRRRAAIVLGSRVDFALGGALDSLELPLELRTSSALARSSAFFAFSSASLASPSALSASISALSSRRWEAICAANSRPTPRAPAAPRRPRAAPAASFAFSSAARERHLDLSELRCLYASRSSPPVIFKPCCSCSPASCRRGGAQGRPLRPPSAAGRPSP